MAILQITVDIEKELFYQFGNYSLEGNWIVDWGDDCIEVNNRHHVYKEAGIHQITVKGDFIFKHLRFALNIVSLDKEEDCGVTDLKYCFYKCTQLKSVPHDWDVSKATNMCWMFKDCKEFNQDLSHWNLEGVVTTEMFTYCPIEEKHKPLTTTNDLL